MRYSISDAVNRFVSMDFTLVILDANMSMEDDHKLLKVMRQAKRPPILLLSSQADHSERLRALQAGAPVYRDGAIWLNEAPGHGVDFNEKEAAKYPLHDRPTVWTEMRLPDGTLHTP